MINKMVEQIGLCEIVEVIQQQIKTEIQSYVLINDIADIIYGDISLLFTLLTFDLGGFRPPQLVRVKLNRTNHKQKKSVSVL